MLFFSSRGHRSRDRMAELQLSMQSVTITTDVVSSNLDQGEVYNIMVFAPVNCSQLSLRFTSGYIFDS
jgi:hypothetical protein